MDTDSIYKPFVSEEYLAFAKSLSLTDKLPRAGISIANLRKLAKSIFPDDIDIKYHEDVMLKGFAIANMKVPFVDKAKELDKLLPYLSSWDHTDTIQSSFKPNRSSRDEMFAYFSSLLDHEELYSRRLGIIWLMSNRNKTDWNKSLELILKADSDEYYISMAVAWALSMFYFDDKSILPRFDEVSSQTKKRALQKIRDSRKYQGENLP